MTLQRCCSRPSLTTMPRTIPLSTAHLVPAFVLPATLNPQPENPDAGAAVGRDHGGPGRARPLGPAGFPARGVRAARCHHSLCAPLGLSSSAPGHIGDVCKSTLLNVKLAGADADSSTGLASRLTTPVAVVSLVWSPCVHFLGRPGPEAVMWQWGVHAPAFAHSDAHGGMASPCSGRRPSFQNAAFPSLHGPSRPLADCTARGKARAASP